MTPQLERWLADGTLSALHVAFSRHPQEMPKTYVQQLLTKEAEMVRRVLLQEGGYLFMCGSASTLAKGVCAALCADAILGEDQYEAVMDDHRLVLDVWG